MIYYISTAFTREIYTKTNFESRHPVFNVIIFDKINAGSLRSFVCQSSANEINSTLSILGSMIKGQ